MVNHTIHTCEQRVRFPLSAIVILFTILPLFSILHHTYTNLPISIHQTQTKTTSPFILYKCVDITLLQNQNYIFIFSYHTHYYFLPNIYIYYLTYYSSLLLYIYQLTIKIHHYLRYISYIYNYYLLTYTEKQNPPIYSLISPYNFIYTYPYLHTVYTIYTITTSSLLLHHIVNILYVYMYIYTYIHTIISIVFILI